jgi:imidazole glycerol-phosphate synthase subunit HisH
MSCVIGIINYGIAGNIHSIKKALNQVCRNVKILNTAKDIQGVDKIVIPGVGSFKEAMLELSNDGLLKPLQEAIFVKPTLGICLGMQILSETGFEYGRAEGLGVIQAEVKPLIADVKVPHMGFNTIELTKENKLLDGLEDEEFYFMHSYEVKISDNKLLTSVTTYGNHKFVSSIQKENLYGVQFHPEKSRKAGIKLFENFVNL